MGLIVHNGGAYDFHYILSSMLDPSTIKNILIRNNNFIFYTIEHVALPVIPWICSQNSSLIDTPEIWIVLPYFIKTDDRWSNSNQNILLKNNGDFHISVIISL